MWWVNGTPHMAVVASRDIEAGEFLTVPHYTFSNDRRACEECRANGGGGALVAYTDGSMATADENAVAGWSSVIVRRHGPGDRRHVDKNEGIILYHI
jgi:hypothetical protein